MINKLDQKLIDYRIIELSTKAAEGIIRDVIAAHIASCPVDKEFNKKLAAFKGGVLALAYLSAILTTIATVIGIAMYFHITP